MKKYITIVIALFMVSSLPSQAQTFVKLQTDSLPSSRGPRVGVVLGGGGAKGAAHIGVLKYLEEMGIPVSFVTGTSMGSIIGGLYALGYAPDELASIIASADWSRLMATSIERRALSSEQRADADKELLAVPFSFGDIGKGRENIVSSLPAALLNSSNIQNLFNRLSIGYTDSVDFNRLPIPYACVATDIITGDSVVIHGGPFPMAIRSSMAIPGVFSPVVWGPWLLADGGLVDNFPVDVCQRMGADIVIGVEVANELATDASMLQSLPQMLSQYMNLSTKGDRLKHREMCDVYIHPDVTGYNMLSFSAESIDTLVNRGYRQAALVHDELMAIKARLEQYGPCEKHLQAPPARKLVDKDTVRLRNISFHGETQTDEERLASSSDRLRSSIVTVAGIEDMVSSLRGTGCYKNVVYTLRPTGTEDLYDMDVYLTPAKPHRFGFGFRFDNEESAAIRFHFGYNELRPAGFKALLNLDLAYNFGLGTRLMWSTGSWGDFNIDYTLSQRQFSVRNSTMHSYNAVHQLARLYYSYCTPKWFSFKVGGKAETFVDVDYMRSRNIFQFDDGFSRSTDFGLFASLAYDSRDDAYFPTKGMALGIDGEVLFNYYKPQTETFSDDVTGEIISTVEYQYRAQFPAYKTLRAYFKPVIGIGSRFAVLPMVGGRAVFDRDYQLYMPYQENCFGGAFDGRYVDHQFAFVGTIGPMLANNLMALGRVDLRYRIGSKFFVSAIANVLFTKSVGDHPNHVLERWPADDDPRWDDPDLEPGTNFWVRGLGLEVAYKSMIGPVSFTLMWNDVAKRVNGYFNIGYFF